MRPWLRRIVVRRARRWLRKRWVRRRLRELDVNAQTDLIDAGASPEERAEIARIYRMLDRMPRDERLVWVLRFVEGETLESIAESARLLGLDGAAPPAQRRGEMDVKTGEVRWMRRRANRAWAVEAGVGRQPGPNDCSRACRLTLGRQRRVRRAALASAALASLAGVAIVAVRWNRGSTVVDRRAAPRR